LIIDYDNEKEIPTMKFSMIHQNPRVSHVFVVLYVSHEFQKNKMCALWEESTRVKWEREENVCLTHAS
jgi:hypothetical protein